MSLEEATKLASSDSERIAVLAMWASLVNSRAMQVAAELGIADELAAPSSPNYGSSR